MAKLSTITNNIIAESAIDETAVLTGNQTITLSGDASGSGATAITATLQPAAITGKTSVTAATGDLVLIADVSDSNNLKNVTVQSILNLAGTGTTGNMNAQYSSGTGGTTIGSAETSIGSVTITPQNSGSKIYVSARMVALKDTGTTRRTVTVRVKRGATVLGQECVIVSQNVASTDFGPAVVSVIDTHGSSTAITYTIFALCDTASAATSDTWSISAIELIGPKGDPGTGLTDGDKGDITISGSGAVMTIDPAAVTYSKFQNVAANSFLANVTGVAATVQEIATNRIPLFGSAITGTASTSTFLRGDGSWNAVTKSDVGLGSVENTALSTWAGSANITTLGTIATGTWNATTISVAKGGTGLTALGTANQLIRVNAGATALEYFTPTYLTANQSITFTASGDVGGSASGTTAISPTLTLATITQSTGASFVKITLDTKGRVTGNSAVAASDLNSVFGSQTANQFYAAPNGTAGTPTFRAIVAADIPTLNQNTTGSAGSVANSFIIKADSGTTEGTDLYTYNGSAAKTLNIVAGTNITITKAAGSWTIASTGGSGGVSTISFGSTGLTPSTATSGAVTVAGTLAVANGGTGLSALGTASQLIRVNAGATALEYFTPSYLTANQTITLSGDVSGSGTTAITTAIGTNKVTNAMLAQVATATFKGRTTAGTGNVEDLTQAQATALLNAFTSTLQGVVPASGGGTTNFLRADGTWAAPAGAGGVTTISFGTTGLTPSTATSGAVTVAGTLGIANGGTGQTTANAAYNALSPMTTLGDLTYEGSGGIATRLAGNTTTAKQYLSQTGTGTVSADPAWATIALNDIANVVVTTPSNGQVLQYNGTNWVNATNSATIAIGSSITSATAGSILFAGTSGVLSQDNTNFFWDNTNKRLNTGGSISSIVNVSSINTIGSSSLIGFTARNTSAASGSTQAGFYVEVTGSQGQLYKAASGYTTYKTISANDLGFYNAVSGNISILNDLATGQILMTAGASSTAHFRLYSNGNLGINQNTDGGFKLDVNGTTRIQSQLTVSAGGINVTSTSSNNTIAATTGTNTISASPSTSGGNVLVIRNTNTVSNTGATLALDTDRNATDSFVDLRLGSTNPKGIRFYASNAALTATPDGAGFQFFNNAGTGNGQVYFDSASNNSAFISFRTAQAAGTITERMIIFANGNVGIGVGGTNNGFKLEVSGTARITGDLTISDASSIIAGSTSGLKIGTATTQKLGFYNKAPIVQPTTAVAASAFVANTGTAVNDASTFGGYTMKQVVQALQNLGLLA